MTEISQARPFRSGVTATLSVRDWPAAMVFYKRTKAGLLEGLPETVDISSAWQLVAICDDAKAKAFLQKYNMKAPSKFRHVPDSFARMLAKIGYCHLLTELPVGSFRPICLPYIF